MSCAPWWLRLYECTPTTSPEWLSAARRTGAPPVPPHLPGSPTLLALATLLAALAVYAALFYVSRAAVTLASGAVRAPRRRRYGEGAQISAVTLWQP